MDEYRVEVIADSSGKWCPNAKTYDTEDKAVEAAETLHRNWILVQHWRVLRKSNLMEGGLDEVVRTSEGAPQE